MISAFLQPAARDLVKAMRVFLSSADQWLKPRRSPLAPRKMRDIVNFMNFTSEIRVLQRVFP